MRRLTSPRRRDLTTRRTLDPDWPKSESCQEKLEEEDEDDSDSYPGSDSLPIRPKNRISKSTRGKEKEAGEDSDFIYYIFSVYIF